jgi:hypothetical protein
MSLRSRAARLAALSLAALSLAAASACRDGDVAAGPAPQPGNVKIVHAITNAGNVSITVDGGAALATNVAPGAVSPSPNFQYHGLAAGSRVIRVGNEPATPALALQTSLVIDPGLYYTVVAAGRVGGTGALAPSYIVLQDSVVADTTNLPASGRIRLRVIHAAATVNAPVDVHAQLVPNAAGRNFSAATRVFAAVPFRGSAAAQVPATTATLNYDVCVIAANVTPTASGSNCAILGSLPAATTANGLLSGTDRARSVVSVIARDPIPPATAPGLIVTTDKPVSP